MKIKFKNEYLVQELNVECHIELVEGKTHFLRGENGIGKTTFLNFLKLNRNKFFQNQKLRFVDQLPLTPLNDISFKDLEVLFKNDSYADEVIFNTFRKNIEPFASQPIRALSGGQNQLVKIGLALYLGGDYFFLDEPFQYLDQKNKEALKQVILSLRENKKTLFIVEHGHDLEADNSDKLLFMERSTSIRIINGN